MPATSAARLHRIVRTLSRMVRAAPAKRRSRPVFLLLVPPILLTLVLLYRSLRPAPRHISIPPTFSSAPQARTYFRLVLTVPPFTHEPPPTYPELRLPPPQPFSPAALDALLLSLINADYPTPGAHLHVVLAPAPNASAFSDVYGRIDAFPWPHGPRTIQNASSGGLFDLPVAAWSPPRGDPTHALLIDAARTPPLPKKFPWYLAAVRSAHSDPDVAGFAIHPVQLPRSVLSQAPVLLYQALPHIPAFAPVSADVWRTFQTWFLSHRGEWFLWPTVVAAKDKKDASWDHYRGTARAHWTLWFSRFCAEYGLYTVYPKSTDLEKPSEQSTSTYPVQRFSFDGSYVTRKETISEENLARIVELAQHHDGVVSMTVVNDAFLETAHSWICNVDVAGIRPPGVVWITPDDVAYNGLKGINNSYAIRMNEFRGGQSKTGTSYGTPGYWLLMLERTQLLRAILERGVGVFAFETDQIWLRDPVPFVNRLVRSGDEVDVVGTLDTRHEIGGNFLYLNPTLATRRVWAEVCRRFENAYRSHKMSQHTAKYKRYMENDQSTLTKLIFFDEVFKARNPVVFRALDTELFVDGRWYDKSKKYYTSEKSKSPIVINNNFLIGIANKKQRAIEHDHWFLTENQCNVDRVKKAVRENEERAAIPSDSQQNLDGASKMEGVDVEASLDEAVSAMHREKRS